jgi:ATP-binding cassette subfamily B protein
MLRGDRDFLILDEPSSGLDAEAEYEIHTRFAEHRRAHTNLLISHRLGAVRHADVLAVLDQGHIIEQGSHTQLMDLHGLYARLFTTQASYYRDDNQ